MGLVNLVSHLITIGAPMVAELSEPTPMLIYSINAASAIVFGWQLLEIDMVQKIEHNKLMKEKEQAIENVSEEQLIDQ
jgi:hypothetical protein